MCALLFLLHVAAELWTDFILEPKRKITSPSPAFIFKVRFKPESQIYRVSQDMRFCGDWWHSKVTWQKNSQLVIFYRKFNQLACFNSNWRQKCPSMRKILWQARNILTDLIPNPTRLTTLRCGYHAEDARDAIVTFKCLRRNYSDVVVWCYRTRKFLVFNHAKFPEIEFKSPV